MICVGMPVYGYCEGYFGRDFWESDGARVEAFGFDWVVVRDHRGHPQFAQFDSQKEMVQCIIKWNKEKPDDE